MNIDPFEIDMSRYESEQARAMIEFERFTRRVNDRAMTRLCDLAWLDQVACDWMGDTITVPLEICAGTLLRPERLQESERHAVLKLPVSAALLALAVLPETTNAHGYVRCELADWIKRRVGKVAFDEISREPLDDDCDDWEAA